MAANNEVGTLYPIEKIAYIAQQHNVPFLCDASQAAGKIPIQFNEWGLTMLAISAHKLYGPQGVGALILRKSHPIEPLMYGGGHQRGLRSGTLNLPGVAGLGEACRLRLLEMDQDETEIEIKRNRLEKLLKAGIPNLVINGDASCRLAGNLHISIPGIPNSAVIARIHSEAAISTGSACSLGVEAPSHVLAAMQLAPELIEGALRVSLGKWTTDQEIDLFAKVLERALQQIQKLLN
jgi:cysteine desulfurase